MNSIVALLLYHVDGGWIRGDGMKRSIKISKICAQLDLEFVGEDILIDTLALCNREIIFKNALSYVTSCDYMDVVFSNTAIKCIVVNSENQLIYEQNFKDSSRKISYILAKYPEDAFYNIHDYLIDKTDFYYKDNNPAIIGHDCNISETAIVEAGVKIGNHVTIGYNSIIKCGSIIEDNATIGCNTVVGAEGFQIICCENGNRRIRHCGGTLVCENAYIGDNNTICNTLFEGYTYIGKNAMLDNLVYVGHNGFVGDKAVITAGVILCGSAVVKNGAWVGANSSVLNRVVIGENSKIGIGSVVTRDILKESLAYGVPAKMK